MKINKLSDVLPAMVVTKTSFEKIFGQNSSLEQRQNNSMVLRNMKSEGNFSRRTTTLISVEDLKKVVETREIKKIVLCT